MRMSRKQCVGLDRLCVFLLMSGFLLLGGCSGGAVAQSESPPSWFVQPDQAYAEARHLMATAAGPSAQAAQNRAFGNLARRFTAEIQVSQELVDEYRETKSKGEVTGTRQETMMVTESDVESRQTLLNAEVLEQAKRGDTHYALVGLKREETLRIYSQRIEGNEGKIDDYLSTAQATDRPINQLVALRKALVLAKANEKLQSQRSIVAGGSASFSSTRPKIEKRLREAQSHCSVTIRGNVPAPIRNQVGATLEAQGFPTIEDVEGALLEATIQYEEHPALEGRPDAHFFRWTLAIELTNRERNRTFETFTVGNRAGAPSEAGAKRRARHGARTVIEDEFSTFLKKTLLRTDQS